MANHIISYGMCNQVGRKISVLQIQEIVQFKEYPTQVSESSDFDEKCDRWTNEVRVPLFLLFQDYDIYMST